jgi:hypothetical protein
MSTLKENLGVYMKKETLWVLRRIIGSSREHAVPSQNHTRGHNQTGRRLNPRPSYLGSCFGSEAAMLSCRSAEKNSIWHTVRRSSKF